MTDQAPTVLSRTHRGHRIRARPLGEAWVGTVHGPDGSIVETIEAPSSQAVFVRGVDLVNRRLKARAT